MFNNGIIKWASPRCDLISSLCSLWISSHSWFCPSPAVVITLSLTSFPSCELITSLLGDLCLNPWRLHSFCASIKGKHVQGEWTGASKTHEDRFVFTIVWNFKTIESVKESKSNVHLVSLLWKFYLLADCQTHVTFKHKNIFSCLFQLSLWSFTTLESFTFWA